MRFLISIFTASILVSCSNNSIEYTVLKNCNIIPIYEDTVLLNKNIIIEKDRIIAIQRIIDNKYLTPQTMTIDCHNKFVIPGFFDSHFHYGRNEELYSVSDSLLLNYGITNVFSFHGSDELLAHKEKIDRLEIRGPRIISTGRNQTEDELSIEEALNRLKDHKEKGFEFVKIYTHLSEAAFEIYNDRAKDFNLRLVGHIPRKIGFHKLMESHQELICHAEEFLYSEPVNYLMGVDDMDHEPNYELIDTIVTTLHKHDKWVSPTLVAFNSILTQAEGSNSATELDSRLDKIADYWNWLQPDNQIPSKFNTDGKRFRLKKGFQFQKLLVKNMNIQGVPLLAGTDAPAYLNLIPGKSLHQELNLLSICGISPYDVLKTATINPATFLRLEEDYGTIELGKIANLIILDDNPLKHINNTEKIYKVILNGKPI